MTVRERCSASCRTKCTRCWQTFGRLQRGRVEMFWTKTLWLIAVLQEHGKWYYSGGRDGRRADLTDAVLADAVLAGADLPDAVLAGAVLTDAVLAGAVLTDADLRGAVL